MFCNAYNEYCAFLPVRIVFLVGHGKENCWHRYLAIFIEYPMSENSQTITRIYIDDVSCLKFVCCS